jgi:TatD DNase family protein
MTALNLDGRPLIDIGVNLLHPQFDADRLDVLERARSAGIECLLTSTDLATTAAAVEFAETHDLYCTAGIHPHDAKDAPPDFVERLEALASSPRVKAIGETGLDFNRNFSPPDVQRSVFEAQLSVAERTGHPVFVHDRDSDGGVLEALTRHAGGLAGMVVHCFTGTERELEDYLALGCFIGITGWICDRRRGEDLRALVRKLPLDRLLIETDAPFLLPHSTPKRWHAEHAPGQPSRRNEPALLPLVAERVALEKSVEPVVVAEATTANARRLFGLPERVGDGG